MLRTRTVFTGGLGGPYLSTFFFDGDTQGQADNAADAAHDFWDTLKAWIVDGMTIAVEPEVVEIDVASGNPVQTFLTTQDAVVTTSGSAEAPVATQGLISWRTGFYLGAREVRGRTFIPGVPQSSLGDGVPAAGYLAALTSAKTGLIANIADFGIYSHAHHVFATAISGTPWNQWATLRSRRD
jgi:hypothetical protein